ncbi:MAG: hypothetical protein ACLFPO_02755 [Spirochaetaceae bacterium]
MKRVFNLMRVFVITQRRTVLVSLGAIYATLLAIFLLGTLTNSGWGTGLEYHRAFFSLALYVAGFIATSMSFSGMHRADRSYAYLTLPASHAEKFVEKLLLTAVLYPLASIITYVLFSSILAGLSPVLFGEPFAVFNPFTVMMPQAVRGYIVAGSVFLFGAAYFRSRHFIKTVLSIAGLFVLLGLVVGASGVAAMTDLVESVEAGVYDETAATGEQLRMLGLMASRIGRAVRFLVLWIMPPLMWALTWLKLRETEVSDAVR